MDVGDLSIEVLVTSRERVYGGGKRGREHRERGDSHQVKHLENSHSGDESRKECTGQTNVVCQKARGAIGTW